MFDYSTKKTMNISFLLGAGFSQAAGLHLRKDVNKVFFDENFPIKFFILSPSIPFFADKSRAAATAIKLIPHTTAVFV